MTPPNIHYSALLMTAGIACLIVVIMIWYTHQAATGARPLIVFLLALSWWDITYAIFWADIPGPTPYFWLDSTLLGAFIVPTAFLLFTLEYAQFQKLLKRPIILSLLIEPVITFILLWTDPWHNLYFGGKRALNTVRTLDVGPVAWANIYYSYILIFISIIVLCITLYGSIGIYRKQTSTILAAAIIPWMVHISFILNGGPLPDADITPFIFTVTALTIAFALMRFHFLDIVPIARSVLIENMSQGVIVLDRQKRVVDINPAAQKLIGVSAQSCIGQPVGFLFQKWPDVIKKFRGINQTHAEVVLDSTHFDVHISPLLDHRNQNVGRLIVWHDITDLKQIQTKFEKLAVTDMLTQIFNRRHLLDLAEMELKRAARTKSPLSLALIDIDHFKNINDKFGHPAGDQALITFAKICCENIREMDLFARFGGEEFALLMPETNCEQAYQVCERLCRIIAQSIIELDKHSASITISLGLTEMESEQDTLELILRRADQALYDAKQSGRNRVISWHTSLEI